MKCQHSIKIENNLDGFEDIEIELSECIERKMHFKTMSTFIIFVISHDIVFCIFMSKQCPVLHRFYLYDIE